MYSDPFRLGTVSRDHVGAVQGVVQTAPTRVGGVERIARVVDRHDELRPRDLCDLGIDTRGVDFERRRLRLQIADFVQVSPVGRGIERRAAVRAMPGIDLCLQLVAPPQQRLVERREAAYERGQSLPKVRLDDARSRHGFLGHERMQLRVDCDIADRRSTDSSRASCMMPSGLRLRAGNYK